MAVNPKKDLRVPNTTKYFDPLKDKLFVSFPSSSSFSSQKMKVESFEARLYWQFKYCRSLGCDTYFFTLTYSDKNRPYKYGSFCFDYEDLRDFLTGGFRKMLLRKYGLTFKYFIGAELGEGAGKRGFENNPHYHVLFFVEPANNPNFTLHYITPESFRHLVRIYWQGFDQDEGFKCFKTQCRYGIVKEGKYGIVVKDFRAISYCSKYVTKDVRLKMRETNVLKLLRFKYYYVVRQDLDLHKEFFSNVVKPLFFTSEIDDKSAFVALLPSLSEWFNKIPNFVAQEFFGNDNSYIKDIQLVCRVHNLRKQYYDFFNVKIDELVSKDFNEWRNRFSNKPRISQGVGLYALNFIEDLIHPMIMVPTSKGPQNRLLPLYFYRKLFTGIVKSNETFFNGKKYVEKPVRVLNNLGVEYKVALLEERIAKLSSIARSNLSVLNEDLYNLMYNSDVNTDCRFSWYHIKEKLSLFFSSIEDGSLFRLYAIYKLVYEDRFFDFEGDFPKLDYIADYRKFLIPSVFSVPHSDLRVEAFLEDKPINYMSYADHPEFLRYTGFFALFDLMADYFFVQKDNELQAKDEKNRKIRSFHVKADIVKFNIFNQ